MQVKLFFAVGADIGQQPVVSPRPPSRGTVIEAVPVEVSETRAPGAALPALALPSPFPGRGERSDRAPSVPRQRLPLLHGTGRRILHALPPDRENAFFAPPGYDAGLRSFQPTLLDVTA